MSTSKRSAFPHERSPIPQDFLNRITEFVINSCIIFCNKRYFDEDDDDDYRPKKPSLPDDNDSDSDDPLDAFMAGIEVRLVSAPLCALLCSKVNIRQDGDKATSTFPSGLGVFPTMLASLVDKL